MILPDYKNREEKDVYVISSSGSHTYINKNNPHLTI